VISELQILDRKNTPIEWWGKVKALSRKKKIRFRPGLNVLIGPNGAGKSTVLKALGMLTHCKQGGIPKITQESVRPFMGPITLTADREFAEGLLAVTDGQQVHYFDPDVTPGIAYGGAAFDYDFLDINMAMAKGSSGQMTMIRFNRVLDAVATFKGPTEDKVGTRINDLWMGAKNVAVRSLEPRIDEGQATLLLDEPARSLDLPNQVLMWTMILQVATKLQIIVATHSPLAFGIKAANYIELKKGYRTECEAALAIIRGSKT
jgi:predicted ATPase